MLRWAACASAAVLVAAWVAWPKGRATAPAPVSGSGGYASEGPVVVVVRSGAAGQRVVRPTRPNPGSAPFDTRLRARIPKRPYRLAGCTGDASRSDLRVLVIDENGVPVPRANVRVRDETRNITLLELATDPDGRVDFQTWVPGPHVVEVSRACLQRGTRLDLPAGRVVDMTIEMPGTGAIVEGVVRHVDRGPLAGMLLVWTDTDPWCESRLQTRTDRRGHYRIDALPPGRYVVDFVGDAIGDTQRRRFEVNVDRAVNVRSFRVGHVALHGVVLDATGAAVPGLTVELTGPDARIRTTTARDGAYRFCDLAPGSVHLRVAEEGFAYTVIGPLEISPNGRRRRDIIVAPAIMLHLHVTDARGTPIRGHLSLRVEPADGGRGWNAPSGILADERGHAIYRQLPCGSFRLRVKVPGLGEGTVDVVLGDGENRASVRLAD